MDSADSDPVRATLRAQAYRLHNTSLLQEIQGISNQQQSFQSLAWRIVVDLYAAVSSPTAAPVLI